MYVTELQLELKRVAILCRCLDCVFLLSAHVTCFISDDICPRFSPVLCLVYSPPGGVTVEQQ